MRIIKKIGNESMMSRDKTLFLCSKMTPIGLYEYVFRWTDSLTEKNCICCFNSTEMESEVLKALLVAKIPTILFVMNCFTDVNNIQIVQALQENRMLIVVLKRNESKGEGFTPRLRNEYVMSLCQHIVCGYINKNGSIYPLLAGRKNVEYLIDNNAYPLVAETSECREQWKVADDKVLLRMYYADMGIHAIHQKLRRTYKSIYTRIQSITQPEELLKGREFEDYVLGLFNVQEDESFVLEEWQGDKTLGSIKPENNSNPDFVFRYNDKKFAVECKWRRKLDEDLSKELFSLKRIENYKAFSRIRKIPVTILLGVGGESCNPDQLYVIPLESIDSIVTQTRRISDFFCTIQEFDASLFLRREERLFSIAEARKRHSNAYRPWSKTDDEELLALYHRGKGIEELMSIFNRNKGGILSRIRKLTSAK